ncbi:MAG: NifB/NifX family molybdenum-iron cluster-binding protein [Pseudomonadota bacterium]
MRIAVISNDRVEVNGRFGKADRFLIYEKNGKVLRFVGERASEPLPSGCFDRDMCDWITDIIADCQQVYMARICKEEERVVTSRGILPVVFQGRIDQIAV